MVQSICMVAITVVSCIVVLSVGSAASNYLQALQKKAERKPRIVLAAPRASFSEQQWNFYKEHAITIPYSNSTGDRPEITVLQ